jgi:hypothetical protein
MYSTYDIFPSHLKPKVKIAIALAVKKLQHFYPRRISANFSQVKHSHCLSQFSK